MSGFESEELIASIERSNSLLRVHRVRTHDGRELIGIRVWKRTWRREGYVPDPSRGIWIAVEEAAVIADALLKGARR